MDNPSQPVSSICVAVYASFVDHACSPPICFKKNDMLLYKDIGSTAFPSEWAERAGGGMWKLWKLSSFEPRKLK